MTNRLAQTSSPYLLQHAKNPVDWYPWGQEALHKAHRENKPIFLSIGYAACHWCHVMAHESFEDPDTAAIMNERYVNIKVDREERPDLDSIFMKAVVALTGSGGWPMSVFLTPDGQPFYGGTYFPPLRRYNMPSFKEVLLAVSESWHQNPDQVRDTGQQISKHIQKSGLPLDQTAPNIQSGNLELASMALVQAYDWRFGGWGSAPKFPQAMATDFLISRAIRGDQLAQDVSLHALDAMAKGGLYDVIGGGFARYSTDDYWLVPHFEKMLYDNAQLSRLYLHGYLLTGEERNRHVCQDTLDFVAREMTHPQGGFYSSMDADSEGVEGKYYLWAYEEIKEALADEEDELFIKAYGITSEGNFEGKNVLQRQLQTKVLAERFSLSPQEIESKLDQMRRRLLSVRSGRTTPGIDDKVLTSWNAIMAISFLEAGMYLNKSDYVEMAMRNIRFLLNNLAREDQVFHSWRDGQVSSHGFLEDYAALIWSLITLYQGDPQNHWYQTAVLFAQSMVDRFKDPAGGFFDTGNDHERLLMRPKELQDNAVPSGNALAATALLRLSALSGRGDWRDMAEKSLSGIQDPAVRYPTAFGQWLYAMDFAVGPVNEVAILGDLDNLNTQALSDAVWRQYRPRTIAAISPFPPGPNCPPLLENRPLKDGLSTAYVCHNFICDQPTTDPVVLMNQLEHLDHSG
jgi:uncharacterized protein YyaL (SSP411 family)